MVLKLLSLFLILFVVKNVYLENNDINQFSVISTSHKPSEFENNIHNRVSRIELQLEMRATIITLKESIIDLQKTKQEIIGEIEELKKQLTKTREIFTETEQNVKKELTETKNEMVAQIKELQESTKLDLMEETKKVFANELSEYKKTVLAENEKRISEIQSNIQTQFKEMRSELHLSGELKEIKTQLTRTQKELLREIGECKRLPTDCREVQKRGYKTSGIYCIQPKLSLTDFFVWCDMKTRGGGWTYVINRFDGSQNFYLNWTDYKQGFGNLSGEHWLGLEHLYELTNSKSTEMLFELIDWDLETVYAFYDNFKIGSESESYRVNTLGSYSGDAGDSFSEHYNAQFSTTDNEHSDNCASYVEGSWWYTSCYKVYLTGKYIQNPVSGTYYQSAIKWKEFHGFRYSLKEARMMIRPRYS